MLVLCDMYQIKKCMIEEFFSQKCMTVFKYQEFKQSIIVGQCTGSLHMYQGSLSTNAEKQS